MHTRGSLKGPLPDINLLGIGAGRVRWVTLLGVGSLPPVDIPSYSESVGWRAGPPGPYGFSRTWAVIMAISERPR